VGRETVSGSVELCVHTLLMMGKILPEIC